MVNPPAPLVAKELVDEADVLQAIREFDALGRNVFLTKYGFGEARDYWLIYNGQRYDSKAIFAAAHGFHQGLEPLNVDQLYGGRTDAAKRLANLGFDVPRSEPGQHDLAAPVTVDQEALVSSIADIKAYQRDGHTAPYQLVVLLWAISGARESKQRLPLFYDVKDELGELLSPFRVAKTAPDPVDPWFALRNSLWWEIAPPVPNDFDKVPEPGSRAGLKGSIYDLIASDSSFTQRAVNAIQDRMGATPEQQYLLVELNLSDTITDGPADGVPKHSTVAVESQHVEIFTTAIRAMAATERERQEASLQRKYQIHLEVLGRSVRRKKIMVDGQILYSDLYDEDTDDLIEVKSARDRVTMRLALGQILDYDHVVNAARLTVVVPGPPAGGILALYRKHGVRVVWPDGDGGFTGK